MDVGVIFFKQKTSYEMRMSDWSADLCSSDLFPTVAASRCRRGRRFLHVACPPSDQQLTSPPEGEQPWRPYERSSGASPSSSPPANPHRCCATSRAAAPSPPKR